MKRKSFLAATVICLGLIIVFALFVNNPNGTGKTIEEAIVKSGRIPLKIIDIKKVNDGAMVFFIKNSLDYKNADVACGFIKKKNSEWKWFCGGEHGSIESSSINNGFSSQYFPGTEGTPFPIYYGVITNPDIERIYVMDKSKKTLRFANIIKNNYVNIWYIYMNGFKGSKFEIYGLAKNYKILNRKEEDISPFYADQKPIKP